MLKLSYEFKNSVNGNNSVENIENLVISSYGKGIKNETVRFPISLIGRNKEEIIKNLSKLEKCCEERGNNVIDDYMTKKFKSPVELITIIESFGINEILNGDFEKSCYTAISKQDIEEKIDSYTFDLLGGKALKKFVKRTSRLSTKKRYLLSNLHQIIKNCKIGVYYDEVFEYTIVNNKWGMLAKVKKIKYNNILNDDKEEVIQTEISKEKEEC